MEEVKISFEWSFFNSLSFNFWFLQLLHLITWRKHLKNTQARDRSFWAGWDLWDTQSIIQFLVEGKRNVRDWTPGCYVFEVDFIRYTLKQVDFVYAPFIERFELAFSGIRNYDIKEGRPKLVKWIEVMLRSLFSRGNSHFSNHPI